MRNTLIRYDNFKEKITMKNQLDLDELFKDFFICTREALSDFEACFGIEDVYMQVLGDAPQDEENHLRASPAWASLRLLHDYALFGRLNRMDPLDIVIDGSKVLKLVSTENHWPEEPWARIVAMGDARNTLDMGDDIELGRVALLANVDVRTVRNAVSAGELPSIKESGLVFIENSAARRWLSDRRGFKPTELDEEVAAVSVAHVGTPAEFGALLKSQHRQSAEMGAAGQNLIQHPSIDAAKFAQLEAGVFALPLDAVFPVADFYQLPRREFLDCVMRVFFREELNTIVGNAAARSAA